MPALRHLLPFLFPILRFSGQFHHPIARRHFVPSHQDGTLRVGGPSSEAGLSEWTILPNNPDPVRRFFQRLLGRCLPKPILQIEFGIGQPTDRPPELRQHPQSHRCSLELCLVRQHQPGIPICRREPQFHVRAGQCTHALQPLVGQQCRTGVLSVRGGLQQRGAHAEHLSPQAELLQPHRMSSERELVHSSARSQR